MDIGLEASAVCYRDTFAKALHDGLTETITAYDPRRANFDFVQSNVRTLQDFFIEHHDNYHDL